MQLGKTKKKKKMKLRKEVELDLCPLEEAIKEGRFLNLGSPLTSREVSWDRVKALEPQRRMQQLVWSSQNGKKPVHTVSTITLQSPAWDTWPPVWTGAGCRSLGFGDRAWGGDQGGLWAKGQESGVTPSEGLCRGGLGATIWGVHRSRGKTQQYSLFPTWALRWQDTTYRSSRAAPELPLLLPSTPRLQAQSHASTILPSTLPQASGAVSSHCFHLLGSGSGHRLPLLPWRAPGAHVSRHCHREPHDRRQLLHLHIPIKGILSTHWGQRRQAFPLKAALAPNIWSPHKLHRDGPTYKRPSKTTADNCFSWEI